VYGFYIYIYTKDLIKLTKDLIKLSCVIILGEEKVYMRTCEDMKEM
jgi:hypothetical protein